MRDLSGDLTMDDLECCVSGELLRGDKLFRFFTATAYVPLAQLAAGGRLAIIASDLIRRMEAALRKPCLDYDLSLAYSHVLISATWRGESHHLVPPALVQRYISTAAMALTAFGGQRAFQRYVDAKRGDRHRYSSAQLSRMDIQLQFAVIVSSRDGWSFGKALLGSLVDALWIHTRLLRRRCRCAGACACKAQQAEHLLMLTLRIVQGGN